jgi:hypothetical protein
MNRNNKALILIAAFLGSIALNIFVDNCVVDEEFNQMSWEAFCETYHYSYWDMSDEARDLYTNVWSGSEAERKAVEEKRK